MSRTVCIHSYQDNYKSPRGSQCSENIIPLTSTTPSQHKHTPHNTAIMKATFFVSLLLSLGVTAMPEADTVTIKEGEFTYTGIDKVCSCKTRSSRVSSIHRLLSNRVTNMDVYSPSSPSVASRLAAAASPATLPTPTAAPESASVLETTAAGLAVVAACSASPALALDSAGPRCSSECAAASCKATRGSLMSMEVSIIWTKLRSSFLMDSQHYISLQ